MSEQKPMNPFLAPVHGLLTDEFQSYSDLREAVNAMIHSGEMDAGIHDSCDFMWFDELAQAGHAERKIEQLYRGNNTPCGCRYYFKAA